MPGCSGRFTADEGTAGLYAALCHARPRSGRSSRGSSCRRRCNPGKNRGLAPQQPTHVVDAHGHRVDADGVVLVQQHGNFQFGAHAVGAGNQHRLFHAGQIRLEQAAQAADPGNHPRDHRALYVLFHQFNGLVSRGDVHARGLIAVTVAFHGVSSLLNLFVPGVKMAHVALLKDLYRFAVPGVAGDGELFAAPP